MRRSTSNVWFVSLACIGVALAGCSPQSSDDAYDVIVRNGLVYDGSGGPPIEADVGIRGDLIATIGDLGDAGAEQEIDASGLAVAPGFINVLSWAVESLIVDGDSQSDIRQGVTLEVFGEGMSPGPLNDAMKAEVVRRQSSFRYDVTWTTLDDFLVFLEERGVSTNVASFVGATTVRVHVLGYEDRAPTAEELEAMQALVRQAMEDGALGVGSSLIYAPAFYAQTDELIALCQVAAEYGGTYISHMRSEGNRLLEAVDELIEIARVARLPAEIYHLKAAGRDNWDKLEAVIERVEQARAEGLRITADIYPYTAGATGLDAAMPPWVKEGGHEAWVARLQDPAIRARVRKEMETPSDEWENLYLAAGSPERVLLVGFKNEALRGYQGKTLAAVAAERGSTPTETAIDLVIEDDSRVATVYFLMSEDNVRRKIRVPWVSLGSDESSLAPEGVFLERQPHPRAFGTFARLFGRYVRDEGLIPLEEAVRRVTTLPAENLHLDRRGAIREGHFADLAIFDPGTFTDHATFEDPHRYATGMVHVLVNGVPVLADGEHTGARPGRVVRGPGWRRP